MDTKYGFVSVLRIRDTPTGDPVLPPPPLLLVEELVLPPDELQAATEAVTHAARPTATAAVRRLRCCRLERCGTVATLFIGLSMAKPLSETIGDPRRTRTAPWDNVVST
jgi:hypothetical protein